MNTLYGKSCQDQRGYRNVNAHFDQEQFEKQVMQRNVTDWDVIKPWSEEDERFFALIETATEKGVVLNTPRLMGFSVLELSKLHIFQAHYGYYKDKYGDKAKFLFTDTDSLCYLIETENPLIDMAATPAFYAGDMACKVPSVFLGLNSTTKNSKTSR